MTTKHTPNFNKTQSPSCLPRKLFVPFKSMNYPQVKNKFFFASIFVMMSFVITSDCNAYEVAHSVNLQGVVKLNRSNSKVRELKTGDIIENGDTVTTGSASSARFLLNDETIIDLKENSKFTFNRLEGSNEDRNGEFTLDFGAVRASVNKKVKENKEYRINTKASTFAVRGTDFAIFEDQQSEQQLVVFEGKVSNGVDKELVQSGFKWIKQNQNASTQQVSGSDLAKIFNTIRVSDLSFIQRTSVGDHTKTRYTGYSTLGVLTKYNIATKVNLPNNVFSTPSLLLPQATPITPIGMLENAAPTSVGIGISPK